MDICKGFKRAWFFDMQVRHGLPPFGRLWGLAHFENRSHGGKLDDDELYDLVVDAIVSCLGTFDESHPPKKGVCRQPPADRFSYYLGRKLAWQIANTTSHRKRLKRGRGRGRYRGPQADRYEHVSQPRSKTALLQLLHRALSRLDSYERTLLRRRHWDRVAWDDIVREYGFRDRFQGRRRLEQIQARLRGFVVEECRNFVMKEEDDFDAVAA